MSQSSPGLKDQKKVKDKIESVRKELTRTDQDILDLKRRTTILQAWKSGQASYLKQLEASVTQ